MRSNTYVLLALCWLALILATLLTVYWGAEVTSLQLQLAIVLSLAIVKAGIIIDGFMELRHSSLRWRAIMYGWPLAMSLLLALTSLL